MSEDPSVNELNDIMADTSVKEIVIDEGHMIDLDDTTVQMVSVEGTDAEEVDDIDENDEEIKAGINDLQWGDDDIAEEEMNDQSPMEAEGLIKPEHDHASLVFQGHTDSVYTIDTNPLDDNIIVSGGGDDKAIVFNCVTGETIKVLDGFKDSITVVAYTFDGAYLAVGAMDGIINIYDVKNDYTILHTLNIESDLESMVWHQRGPILLCGSSVGNIWMWDAVTGQCMRVLAGHSDAVRCVAFTLDGKSVLSGGDDCTTALWNPKTGKPTFHNRGHFAHEAPVITLKQHPSQPLYVSGAEDGSVFVASTVNGKILHRLTEAHTDSVESVSFGKGPNPLLATASVDKTVKLYDLARTAQLRQTLAHPDAVLSMNWHPTKPVIYTVCADGVIRAWHSLSGDLLKSFSGHTDSIIAACVSKTGTKLLTGSDDKTVRVFDISDISV